MTSDRRTMLPAVRDALLNRRAAVGGSLAALLAAGLSAAPATANAGERGRKPKKNWPPTPPPTPGTCTFTFRGETMALDRDCTATGTIVVPDGVALDGAGHTIRLEGDTANFASLLDDDWSSVAGVLVSGASGTVRNLTVDGSGLSGECVFRRGDNWFSWPEGISFVNAEGSAERVTVKNVRVAGKGCGWGLTATGTGGQTVSFSDISASGSTVGITGFSRYASIGLSLAIDGANIEQCDDGIRVDSDEVSGTVTDSRIDVRVRGIGGYASFGDGPPPLDVADATVNDHKLKGRRAMKVRPMPANATRYLDQRNADFFNNPGGGTTGATQGAPSVDDRREPEGTRARR